MYGTSTETVRYDDLPEQEYLPVSAPGGWSGHRFMHRFQGAGHKLGRLFKLDPSVQQQLKNLIGARIIYDAAHPRFSGLKVPTDLAAQFDNSLQDQANSGRIVLFSSLMHQMDTVYLSVAHPREARRESYWVLLKTKLHQVAEVNVVVAKVHRYALCYLPIMAEQSEDEEE